jgi:Maltokinase N-terminal cap domain
MATIHRTTLTPTKLELLAGWLPSRPWYRATGRAPELARAGGFRLDDPEGEVGIEFMVVTDGRDGDDATSYLIPMTYRGSARADDAEGLIGTSEHGVLGRRWVYDGTRDPVLVAQLVALLRGTAQAQAQSVSDTLDPTVLTRPPGAAALTPAGFTVAPGIVAEDAPDGTDLRVAAGETGALAIRVHRVLSPAPDGAAGEGSVTALWRLPDGTRVRGIVVTAHAR